MYSIVYTKKAVGDIANLKSAKLDNKAKALIELIKNDPYKTPPSYEKLQGNLKGAYSRRINIKHRFLGGLFLIRILTKIYLDLLNLG